MVRDVGFEPKTAFERAGNLPGRNQVKPLQINGPAMESRAAAGKPGTTPGP
jgi:hypothetical protein